MLIPAFLNRICKLIIKYLPMSRRTSTNKGILSNGILISLLMIYCSVKLKISSLKKTSFSNGISFSSIMLNLGSISITKTNITLPNWKSIKQMNIPRKEQKHQTKSCKMILKKSINMFLKKEANLTFKTRMKKKYILQCQEVERTRIKQKTRKTRNS